MNHQLPWRGYWRWLQAGVLAMACLAGSARAADDYTVFVAIWRGCEDACRGFQDYLTERGLPVRFVMRDAEQQPDRLPGFVAEAKAMKADLVLTWGTSVTLGMAGRWNAAEPEHHLTEIPVIFMIVADPVAAGITRDAVLSGRRNVTGTRNRVPEEVQLRAMSSYSGVRRIGLIYNTDEVNAVIKADEMRTAAQAHGVAVVDLKIDVPKGTKPQAEQILAQVQRAQREGVEFLYVSSSSFLMKHREDFTRAALEAGIPVATAYEAMVTEANALLSVAARYYSVGRVAGFQAEQILLNRAEPGELAIKGLDRFAYLVNMDAARRLKRYPPLSVLRYAQPVNIR